jgi:hypothetical protein
MNFLATLKDTYNFTDEDLQNIYQQIGEASEKTEKQLEQYISNLSAQV